MSEVWIVAWVDWDEFSIDKVFDSEQAAEAYKAEQQRTVHIDKFEHPRGDVWRVAVGNGKYSVGYADSEEEAREFAERYLENLDNGSFAIYRYDVVSGR